MTSPTVAAELHAIDGERRIAISGDRSLILTNFRLIQEQADHLAILHLSDVDMIAVRRNRKPQILVLGALLSILILVLPRPLPTEAIAIAAVLFLLFVVAYLRQRFLVLRVTSSGGECVEITHQSIMADFGTGKQFANEIFAAKIRREWKREKQAKS